MDHALKCAMQEQAKAAVLDGKWEQLRFLGNRFERAGCYAEAWNALAQKVEKTSTQTLPIWPGPGETRSDSPTPRTQRTTDSELATHRSAQRSRWFCGASQSGAWGADD